MRVHVAVGVREVVVERVVVVGRDVYLFDDVDGQIRRYGLVDRVVVRFPGVRRAVVRRIGVQRKLVDEGFVADQAEAEVRREAVRVVQLVADVGGAPAVSASGVGAERDVERFDR